MNTSIDASIPVLTEIIHPVTAPEAEAVTEAIISTSLPATTAPATVTPTDADTKNISIPDEQWQTLEQSLKEDVLKHVLARVDFVLEHRVRDNLADVLQTAVEGLAKEIRAGLKNSLEELVTRAVTQEINKVKNSK